jgi:chromate reductase
VSTTEPSFTAVAISGSLRAASSNTGLVRMAARVAPPELQVQIYDHITDLPYYNEDLEADPPAAVREWRAAITAADALIVGMPEYNFGPAALAKNAIDWLSRPPGQHTLTGKGIAILTSGGKGGGSNVQGQLGPILGWLGNTVVAEPAVQIAMGMTKISSDGTTTDPEVERLVTEKMANLVAALRAR